MGRGTWLGRAAPCEGMKTLAPSALKYALIVSAVGLCTALNAQSSSTSSSTSTDSTRATASSAAPSASDRRADMGDSKLKHSDRSFFEKAAKAGTKEVEISQSTLEHLSNPQVKSFAQMMVSDHSQANQELMALAAKKGVTLPSKELKYDEKWSKKANKDSDLDEDYIKQMVDDHEDAVKLFEKAAKSDDPEIAAFAQKTLPTLQHHLTMARDLKKMVK